MRLIDADTLDKKLLSGGFLIGLCGALSGHKLRRKFTIDEIRAMLNKAPTIEPVKRGEWFHNTELGEAFRTCSNCKISMGMAEGEILERFQFCPHCGADMRAQS